MNVLIIAPHMDDEVLGCGGAIARHVDDGDAVEVCVVGNRAYGHAYDDDAIEAEKACARRAQEVLGYGGLTLLDLPDERMYAHFQEVLIAIEEVVGRVRPETVYVPHALDLHQDHRTVAHAANIALRSSAAPFARRVLAYEVPSGTEQTFAASGGGFAANVYVDIEAQIERKLAALAAYERESRPFPHPRSPETLRARALLRGAECGLAAAEGFAMLREVTAR